MRDEIRRLLPVAAALFVGLGGANRLFTRASEAGATRRVVGDTRRPHRRRFAGFALGGALLAAVLPLAVTAFTKLRGSTRWEEHRASCSLVNNRLPTFSGTTLSGREVTLPADAAGEVILLVTDFGDDVSADVDRWVRAFTGRYGDRGDMTFYVAPMIGHLTRLSRASIEDLTRRSIAREWWDRVLVVTGRQEEFRRGLCAGPDETSVYLVDRDGRVLCHESGWSEAKFETLREVADRAAVGTPSAY